MKKINILFKIIIRLFKDFFTFLINFNSMHTHTHTF